MRFLQGSERSQKGSDLPKCFEVRSIYLNYSRDPTISIYNLRYIPLSRDPTVVPHYIRWILF